MRVLAAMSGGVDSSVAAARMAAAGHDVVGVHLALSRAPATARQGARGCCTAQDASDARRVADVLGIPFYVWDFSEDFDREVVADFAAEYAVGRTPNPCLRCNETIKFAALLDKALAVGFDVVATGHYAKIVEPPQAGAGQRELHRAADRAKDQSYVLGVLQPDQLAAAAFPLGDIDKPAVRREASRLGLAVADKPDSHDICFIPDGDTRGWLSRRLGDRPGAVVDPDGVVVGEHRGAFGYTVGQRRGVRLDRPSPDGRARYVLSVRPETNTVVVGPEELLGIDVIHADRARWCGPPPPAEVSVGAQLRAHGPELPAVATVVGDTVTVRLRSRSRGVSPGQSVVLYDGERVVGSAVIQSTGRDEAREPGS